MTPMRLLSLALFAAAAALMTIATMLYATHRRWPEMTVEDYRALLEAEDGIQPADWPAAWFGAEPTGGHAVSPYTDRTGPTYRNRWA